MGEGQADRVFQFPVENTIPGKLLKLEQVKIYDAYSPEPVLTD